MQNRQNRNVFKSIRCQKERVDKEVLNFIDDYNVFYKDYEPNAVSYFNSLKEKLVKKGLIKVNYNDFRLVKRNNYSVQNLLSDLRNLDLARKYS